MNLFSIEEAGDKGASRPFPLHPKSPPQRLRFAPDTLRTFLVDEAEHFLHNHHASVASLRLLFTFTPECRSPSLRNRCSPSPEYRRSTGLLKYLRKSAFREAGMQPQGLTRKSISVPPCSFTLLFSELTIEPSFVFSAIDNFRFEIPTTPWVFPVTG